LSTLSLAVIFFFLHTKRPTGSWKAAVQKFDFFGIILIAAATTLILLAFEWAQQGMSWSSSKVLSCLIIGIVVMVAFIFAETRATVPVIPLRLFNHRTRIAGFSATFLHSLAYASLSYYMPLYFQAVKGQNASESGVNMLPVVLAFAIVSTSSGYAITATQRYDEPRRSWNWMY
jgi:hypothetical protein